jgi:hypothetical protein
MFVAHIQHCFAASRSQLHEFYHLSNVIFPGYTVYTFASVGTFLVSVQYKYAAMRWCIIEFRHLASVMIDAHTWQR